MNNVRTKVVWRLVIFSGVGMQKLFTKEEYAHETFERSYFKNLKPVPRYRVERVRVYASPFTLTATETGDYIHGSKAQTEEGSKKKVPQKVLSRDDQRRASARRSVQRILRPS